MSATWSRFETELPGMRLATLNTREHYLARARRTKSQRGIAARVLAHYAAPPAKGEPLRITITRVGPRTLDSDNLAGSAKAVRDGIADWLGVDDGSDWLEWRYEQRRGDYAVSVRIERRNGDV